MNAIFAVNQFDGFGVDNTMPWPRSPIDLKRFKELTTGHTVIMGANTWSSDMPKPLPNRRNIVLSNTLIDSRCEIYSNVTSLLMAIQQDEQVFVIGGAKVLWTLRPYINKIYFTRHHHKQRADVTIDTEKFFEGFKVVSSEVLDTLTFDILERQ